MAMKFFRTGRFFGIFLLLLAIFTSPVLSPALAADAGHVVSVTPGAFAERNGAKIPLGLRSAVMEGDTLVTDATGRLRVLMTDDTAINLGGDTTFTLQSYKSQGKNPEFKGNMTGGLLRVLTGSITASNPKGFAITTPEATVGIRGTMFSLRRWRDGNGRGYTTLFTENTMRNITMNDVDVPGGHKMTLPRPSGQPEMEPISPEDRRILGRDLAAAGRTPTQAAAPEPGMAVAANSTEILGLTRDPTGPEEGLPSLPINNLTNTALPPLTPMTASVSGSLSPGPLWTSGGGGTFSFGLNLQSGAISNAAMSGFAENAVNRYEFNLAGGSGTASPSGWYALDLAGTVTVTGTSPGSDGVYGKLWGNDTLLTMPNGGAVTGDFAVFLDTDNSNVGNGALSGTLKK